MFSFEVITYLLFTLVFLFVKYKISNEINNMCGDCVNSVNKPRRSGLYKINFLLSVLSYAAFGLVIYTILTFKS